MVTLEEQFLNNVPMSTVYLKASFSKILVPAHECHLQKNELSVVVYQTLSGELDSLTVSTVNFKGRH